MMQSRARRTSKSSAKKAPPPFPQSLFRKHYSKLGISHGEAMMICHQVDHWWEEDKPSFVSDGTVAKEMGVSRRQIQRWKLSLKKKGYLRCEDRFEHGRQTSSRLHYAPLLYTLLEVSQCDVDGVHGETQASYTPTTQAAYLNQISSTKRSSSKKRGLSARSTSMTEEEKSLEEPGLMEAPSSLRSLGNVGQENRPARGADPDNPYEVDTMPDKNKLQDIVDRANDKFTKDLAAKKERKAQKAAEKAAVRAEKADQEGGQGTRDWAEAKELEDEWNTAMEELRPQAPVKKSGTKAERGRIIGQFQQLIANWGMAEAKRLVWSAIEHWDLYKKPLKKAPRHPHIGFLLACDRHFANNVTLIEDYERAKAAFAEWRKTKKPYELRPPEDIDRVYQKVIKEMKEEGFLEE